MSGRTIHEVPLVSEVKGGMKIPISDGGNLPQTASVEQINKFISDQIRIYVNDLLKRYVEKIDGKGLSTNDFTNTLKSKLDSLSNYDDTQIVSNIAKLQKVLDTLVSGDVSSKIESFNEIISFLENVEDSESFEGIVSGITNSIKGIEVKLSELGSKVGIHYKSEDSGANYSFPFLFESGKYYEIQIKGSVSAIYTSNSPEWDKDRIDTIEPFEGVFIFTPSLNAAYFSYWAISSVVLSIIEVSNPLLSKIKEVEESLINSQVNLYFAGNEKPNFEFGEDYVKVKGKSYNIYGRLYNNNNKTVRNDFVIKAEKEYIINRNSVFSLRSNNGLEVSNFVSAEYGDLNNIPLLFYNADGVLSGIMASYAISAYNSMQFKNIENYMQKGFDGIAGINLTTSGVNSHVIPYKIQANRTYKLLFLKGYYTTAYTTNSSLWGDNGRVDTISESGQREVEFTASEDANYISFWQSTDSAELVFGELESNVILREDLNKKYGKLYDDDCFLYFAGAGEPNFKIDSDNAVIVTFPSWDLYARLYNKDFKVVKSFTIPALSEYKIAKYESLVLNNNSLKVVNFTNVQIENGVTLFVCHADGVYSGHLAFYYYDWLNKQSKPNGTGIMDLFPSTSYLPRIATIRRKTPYSYSPTNTPLVLMCISDVHGDNTNVDRFNEWYNEYKEYIDDRINLGDTTTNDLGQYNSTSAKYFAEHDGTNILHQVGNHDVAQAGTKTYYWDGSLTSKEIFDKFTGLLNKEGLGLTFPENAEVSGYNYYYKDYVGMGISTKGIRLIMLDTAIEDVDYIKTQLVWLQSVLNDALSKQYSVVCATHFPPNNVTQFNFKNKGIVTGFASTDEVKTFSKYIPSTWHDAVDSFIDKGGDFITWISGHVHSDYLGTIVGHERQLSICITTGSHSAYNAEKHQPIRLDGTKTQDAFNHIAFDTYYGRISMVRVGCNFDSFGRTIDMICIDYKNKEVIV